MFELADAVDVPADLLDALAWPPDVGAVYQHPDVSAWRAWIWAAVASGDEYETGPPDVPSFGTWGVVRLGVSPDDVVLEELVPLLEAGLSPSQALDYWAAEDTEETHGAFTQKEWAEIRGVSRQAVGANAGNARDVLDRSS